MATVNTNLYNDSDADPDDEASQVNKPLSWEWATWPGNLRKAAGIAIILALALAGLVAAARWADKDFAKQLKLQTDLKIQAQTRLNNADQERASIDKHLPLLRQLEAQGIFGEEKRLEWIEQLRAIEKRWVGVKLQYTISAQNPLPEPPASPVNTPANSPAINRTAALPALLPSGQPIQSFGAFQSDMNLTLTVLHEGDVFAILDELKTARLGRFHVQQCSFKRSGNNAPIEAACGLRWVSMKAYTPT